MNYNKIEEKRKYIKIRQEDLADKAGISVPGYKRILKTGSTNVSTLERISEALEVPMSYWWEDEPIMVREPDIKHEKQLIKENQQLKKQVERDQRTIDQLLDKLEKKNDLKRAANSG